MVKNKQEGGLKPLWVKCSGCEKWNGIQPANILRYLEKILSPVVKPVEKKTPEQPREGHD